MAGEPQSNVTPVLVDPYPAGESQVGSCILHILQGLLAFF